MALSLSIFETISFYLLDELTRILLYNDIDTLIKITMKQADIYVSVLDQIPTVSRNVVGTQYISVAKGNFVIKVTKEAEDKFITHLCLTPEIIQFQYKGFLYMIALHNLRRKNVTERLKLFNKAFVRYKWLTQRCDTVVINCTMRDLGCIDHNRYYHLK